MASSNKKVMMVLEIDHDANQEKENTSISEMSNPIQVDCHDLGLIVQEKAKDPISGKTVQVDKHILHGITARFRPGRMTAIMGSSGAGKTSLLNILSGDLPAGSKSSGEILLNGVSVLPKKLKDISGFVYQDDLILSTMTVREAIHMSAVLRLPQDMSLAEKDKRVDSIIKLLGLEKARDTIIGSEAKKGISGGERKRTSIAIEMVTNPALLFLDEPTSGLDTFTAYQVVLRLKSVAMEGHTVVATIHQPSSKIFYMFDDLLLLAQGRVAYYGSTEGLVGYFAGLGLHCPQYNNPADYVFMNVLNSVAALNDSKDTKKEKGVVVNDQKVSELLEEWQKSPFSKALVDQIIKDKTMGDPERLAHSMKQVRRATASLWIQFTFLVSRIIRDALRSFMIVRMRIGRSVFMGLLTGSIYWNIPSHVGYAQFQDRACSINFILNNEVSSAFFSTILAFGLEKAIVRREHQAGFYEIGPYYAAKVITDVPLAMISPLLSIGVAYFMIGLRPSLGHYLVALVTGVVLAIVSNAIGILVSAIFSPQAAINFVPVLIIPLMMFGGLVVNLKNIPTWYRFMPHISPLKYAFTAMVKNEFEGLVFTNCIPDGKIPCTGEAALELLGLDNELGIYANWGILLVMYVVLALLGFVALKLTSRRK